MTIKITSRKAKNNYGDWEVVTVSSDGKVKYKPYQDGKPFNGEYRFNDPWKFVFYKNRLRYVVWEKGSLFIIDVPYLVLHSSMPAKKQVQQMIPYITDYLDNVILYRMNDLGLLKYAPVALIKTLGITGAPMWEINGLPGSNKRR